MKLLGTPWQRSDLLQCFSNFNDCKNYPESLPYCRSLGPSPEFDSIGLIRSPRIYSNKAPRCCDFCQPLNTLNSTDLCNPGYLISRKKISLKEARCRFSRKSLPETNQWKCVWKMTVQLHISKRRMVASRPHQWPNASAISVSPPLPCDFAIYPTEEAGYILLPFGFGLTMCHALPRNISKCVVTIGLKSPCLADLLSCTSVVIHHC